jgi:hypothetical protein
LPRKEEQAEAFATEGHGISRKDTEKTEAETRKENAQAEERLDLRIREGDEGARRARVTKAQRVRPFDKLRDRDSLYGQ